MLQEQVQLSNGCKCSNPTIFPDNYLQAGASVEQDWYIQYYFYSPECPKGKLKILKRGINRYKNLTYRRAAIKLVYDTLMAALKSDGYNPITRQYHKPVMSDVKPDTPFISALWVAREKISAAPSTLSDIKSIIKGVEAAAGQLQLSSIPISQVRRQDILSILDRCKVLNKKFSNARFNKYRSYLMMLFDKLIELQATEIDPITKIKKRSEEMKIRQTLTPEERIAVNNHLKIKTPRFWRFLHIFYHSSSRETEMLMIQGKHVDLKNQEFKVLVKKGKRYEWETRPIKDIILPLWVEAMENCGSEDYAFSRGLIPGKQKIRPDQISRRWRTHVKAPNEKGGLGITADFYSLKASNLDEIAAALDIQAAAAAAGHTTPVITMKHYATGERKRQNQKIKKVANKFA